MENNILTQVGLPLALALIMFAMGLGLRLADFGRIMKQPKDFAVGSILQMVSLPIIAFMVAKLLGLGPEMAVGLMLLAACPGGTTSNLLTHMGRGDVALSITLTAAISLASIVTLPLILGFSLDHFMGQAAPELPLVRTVLGLFAITTVPVALGMTVRRFAPAFADWAEPKSRPLVSGLFVLIVIGAVISERAHVADYFAQAGIAAITLNVITMLVAYGASRIATLGPRQRTAVTLECGLQNATLAIVIATSMLGSTALAVPGAIYGLLMFITGAGYAFASARRQAAAA